MMINGSGETTPNLSTSDLPGYAVERSGVPGMSRSVSCSQKDRASQHARRLTALGRCGYILEVCDPNPLCIGRFSHFIRHVYHCPPMGTDPHGYLAFVLQHLTQEHYDVLLPVHEQAFLFAKVLDQLPASVAVALANFDAFMQVQGKVAFARLMDQLSLPQPPTHIVRLRAELEELDLFPCYIKTDYSTAGQGVWRITKREELNRAIFELEQQNILDGAHEFVVQQEASGDLCQAQAVFAYGRLLATHCTQTRGVSVGGGHAARMGVDHPVVWEHLAILGQALRWHGPLALDYLFDKATGSPTYIECNPRLVEPMNATLSGVNLADLTVGVTLGQERAFGTPQRGRPGVRSHSLMAILLGLADHEASRRGLLRTILDDVGSRGIFANSPEDLTPLSLDLPSLVPLSVVTGQLLLRPHVAHHIATGAQSQPTA